MIRCIAVIAQHHLHDSDNGRGGEKGGGVILKLECKNEFVRRTNKEFSIQIDLCRHKKWRKAEMAAIDNDVITWSSSSSFKHPLQEVSHGVPVGSVIGMVPSE